MSTLKIVALAGSTRRDSFNKLFLRTAVRFAEQAGAEVSVIDLKDYPLPLYDGDCEAERGLPAEAAELKKRFQEADALLISSPEYNASISAVLKNTIDWTSRPGAIEGSAFAEKPALLISASPGALGGLRGLNHLRDVLTNLGVHAFHKQQALPQASSAFDESGELKDPSTSDRLDGLVKSFISYATRLKASS